MRAVILAAGYATRMYPLTQETPKPLIEVGGKALLEHLLEKLQGLPLRQIYVVTNARFHEQFRIWLVQHPQYKVKLINDGTMSNEHRLGAIGDLHFVVEQQGIADDLLVVAGDNLFRFSLGNLVDFFQEKQKSVVAFREVGDMELVRKKLGVGTLEGTKVVRFEEKPAQPSSTLAATACYVLSKADLPRLGELLQQDHADSPGHFIRWLVKYSEVHGKVFQESWFDVGSMESLAAAKMIYGENR